MATAGRSVPEVLHDIVGNIQEIIRSEFRLAKAEVKVEAFKARGPLTTWAIGALIGLYAVGLLLFTVVMAMATVMATWLAALIVGAVTAVVSIALISAGSSRLKRVNKVPERTIESLKENVQWAKDQIK
jgi:predicted phage tail protein